jgi:hypothetical protein
MSSHDEEPESLAASASLFDRRDREKVRNYASFVAGSVRRHRLLVAAVFVSIIGASPPRRFCDGTTCWRSSSRRTSFDTPASIGRPFSRRKTRS